MYQTVFAAKEIRVIKCRARARATQAARGATIKADRLVMVLLHKRLVKSFDLLYN